MVFYVAKALQLAGLIGMPMALYAGITHEAGMARELGLAALAVLMDAETGFPALLKRAVKAAADRGRELGK